jgi:hypothetical protein
MSRYTDIDSIVINYRNQVVQLVNGILMFDGSLVIASHGACGPCRA